MTITTTPHRVLADSLPSSRVRDLGMVAAGTLSVAALSQVVIPLGFTPVPLNLGTFGVLVVAAALGPVRALFSLGAFLLLGVAGVPVFAGFQSGWQTASFGYVVGYLAAAGVVGLLASRGGDRSILSAGGVMAVGNVVIYAGGISWLAWSTHIDVGTALQLGLVPFLVGDLIKILAASVMLPGARKAIGRLARSGSPTG